MSRATIQRGEGTARKHQYYEASGYCKDYDPCPINMQCRNKASHMRLKCQNCPVPKSIHNDRARNFMIRRENFAIKVTHETGKRLLEWQEQLAKE